MSPRLKITFAVLAGLWLLAFFGGGFWHDKPHANDIALDTQIRILRNFRMHIDRKEKKADGSFNLVVRGDYQGQKTGLNFWVRPSKVSHTGDREKGKVVFQSLGPESDHFLAMMTNYYVGRLAPKPMLPKLTLDFETMEGKASQLETGEVHLEVYCPEKKKVSPGSFELIVDWDHDVFYLAEISLDYRPAILAAFRGE